MVAEMLKIPKKEERKSERKEREMTVKKGREEGKEWERKKERKVREGSFLMLGARAEDNFTVRENFIPHLENSKRFRTQPSFSKMVLYPIQNYVHKT